MERKLQNRNESSSTYWLLFVTIFFNQLTDSPLVPQIQKLFFVILGLHYKFPFILSLSFSDPAILTVS